MKELIERINQVLSEWDPAGVGEIITADEYKGYIPTILSSVNDEEKLMECLENILINEMDLDYDPFNKSHVKSLQKVCRKIMSVCKV